MSGNLMEMLDNNFSLQDLGFFSNNRQIRNISRGMINGLSENDNKQLYNELRSLELTMEEQQKKINNDFDKIEREMNKELANAESLTLEVQTIMKDDVITIEDKAMYIKSLTDLGKNKVDIMKEKMKVISDKYKQLRDEKKSYYDFKKIVFNLDEKSGSQEDSNVIATSSTSPLGLHGVDNKLEIIKQNTPQSVLNKIEHKILEESGGSTTISNESTKIEEVSVNKNEANVSNIEEVKAEVPIDIANIFKGTGDKNEVIESRINSIKCGDYLNVSLHPLDMKPVVAVNELINSGIDHQEVLFVDIESGKFYMKAYKASGEELETYNPKGLKHIGAPLIFYKNEGKVKLPTYTNKFEYAVVEGTNDMPDFYIEQWNRKESVSMLLSSDTLRTI